MNPFFKNGRPGMQAGQQGRIDPQAVNTVKGMISNLKSVSNPEMVINRLASQNPLLGNVMRLVGGRDPRQVFYAECQKCGVDPNEVINMLK